MTKRFTKNGNVSSHTLCYQQSFDVVLSKASTPSYSHDTHLDCSTDSREQKQIRQSWTKKSN